MSSSFSFGARSETKPVWRISLLTNVKLVIVVAFPSASRCGVSTTRLWAASEDVSMPLSDCFLLLAAGAIARLVQEMAKIVRVRHARRLTPH